MGITLPPSASPQVAALPQVGGAAGDIARTHFGATHLAEARREIEKWFADRGWSPFRFQRQVWNAYLAGESGLIHATTGNGKTYAAWLGPIIEALAERESVIGAAASGAAAKTKRV